MKTKQTKPHNQPKQTKPNNKTPEQNKKSHVTTKILFAL